MRVVITCKYSIDVESALRSVVEEINKKLEKLPGRITKLDARIDVGVAGALVVVEVLVNGNENIRKMIVGVNTRGLSEEQALERAERIMNERLEEVDGEIVDLKLFTIPTPIPGRVYATAIAAVNLSERIDPKECTANERRERLKRAIDLLGGDPHVLNLVKVAEAFGVSRDIIYRDLRELGYER